MTAVCDCLDCRYATPGRAFFAPSNCHMLVGSNGTATKSAHLEQHDRRAHIARRAMCIKETKLPARRQGPRLLLQLLTGCARCGLPAEVVDSKRPHVLRLGVLLVKVPVCIPRNQGINHLSICLPIDFQVMASVTCSTPGRMCLKDACMLKATSHISSACTAATFGTHDVQRRSPARRRRHGCTGSA